MRWAFNPAEKSIVGSTPTESSMYKTCKCNECGNIMDLIQGPIGTGRGPALFGCPNCEAVKYVKEAGAIPIDIQQKMGP